jgi:hypothetical protein
LQGTALEAGLGGDGFGGLALEAGELAAQDGEGMGALFFPAEAREVALGEGGETVGAGADGLRGEFSISEQGLGVGVVEDVHSGLRGEKGTPVRIAARAAAG